MKKRISVSRLCYGLALCAVIGLSGMSVSCMTTYDAEGRPVNSVDPALAIAGVAAAGLAGYAIANNNDSSRGHGGGYGPPPPRRYCR